MVDRNRTPLAPLQQRDQLLTEKQNAKVPTEKTRRSTSTKDTEVRTTRPNGWDIPGIPPPQHRKLHILMTGINRSLDYGDITTRLQRKLHELYKIPPGAPDHIFKIEVSNVGLLRPKNVSLTTEAGTVEVPKEKNDGWAIVRSYPDTTAALAGLLSTNDFKLSMVEYITEEDAEKALDLRPMPTQDSSGQGHDLPPTVGAYNKKLVKHETPDRGWAWDCDANLLGCYLRPCMNDWHYVLNRDTDQLVAYVRRRTLRNDAFNNNEVCTLDEGWLECYSNGPRMRFTFGDGTKQENYKLERLCHVALCHDEHWVDVETFTHGTGLTYVEHGSANKRARLA